MTEPFFPLAALSEAQRAQALERFTIDLTSKEAVAARQNLIIGPC